MSRGRVHRRKAGGGSRIVLSQLVDWDIPGRLCAVIRDLETDEMLARVPVIELDGSKPVLLSLEFERWRQETGDGAKDD